MQFGPSLNKTSLPGWHLAFHQRDRIDTEDCGLLLIISVKVRRMMPNSDFPIHSNDDAVETAQFRHGSFYDKLGRRSCQKHIAIIIRRNTPLRRARAA